MKWFLLIFVCLSTTSCTIYSTENEDGSYTIGLNSDSRGESANSVLALLTKSAGYTLNDNQETQTPERLFHSESAKEQPTLESRGLLEPHLEILQLIEVFLKFKGELVSRLHSLVTDNYDLLRSVYSTLVNKIGNLHSFTLTGIRVLRKVLEFAIALFGQWQMSYPPAGNQESDLGTAFGLRRNGNFFRK
ncbi:uncharacterized protein LOC103313521 [Tribolium castaneum]|uniref:Uncharacterized protein n=1 Tax=Tribolium castaneum TaxID=7070 RepID=D6WRH4_TRICA|nr:PREDICTED: uncharacterized protein LOC103313521 [Tribolium castaneum]EFA06568.1 hypothetical protein TcasGA2_TC009479 [Tribolium castaneum]|eukprot:XP_008195190.1 PREDICTED: uncharacterized protein LOC103313521 [Tribolium castaneum]